MFGQFEIASLLRGRGLWAVIVVALAFLAAPGVARAQATCIIDFSVAYNSGPTQHVMSQAVNADEFAACDTRYPAVDSGFGPPSQSGSTTGGGTFSTVVNPQDDTLTYTPAATFSGTDTFTVYFCNDPGCSIAGRRAASVTVIVGPPTITVTPASLPAATAGAPYSQTLGGSGGAAPYHDYVVTAGALPAGLTLSLAGVISGTPTAAGSFPVTIRTTDSSTGTSGQFSGSTAYTLAVNAPAIVVNPVTLPGGQAGAAYSQTITSTGGTAPYAYSVSAGPLPTGLTLSAAGLLSGTPTTPGSYPFTIRSDDATTGGTYFGSRAYTLVLAAPPAPVANAVSATVAYGSSGNAVTLNITGGAATSVAVAAQASTGTAVATGTSITYTSNATYSGPDSFTYTATNAGGTSAPATVSITVTPQPPIANAVSATVAFNSSTNSIPLNITGGTPVSLATPTTPTHGSVSVSGLTITYTPTAGYFGPDSFTYTATNAGGTSAPATVSLTVNPTAPVANAGSATVAYGSSGNPITLNITGGAPASVDVAAQASNGTAVATGTSITYTPNATYFGPDSFSYTATNAGGTSAPATVSITVNPQPPIANAVSATVAFNSSNNAIALTITGGTPVSLATPGLPSQGAVSISGLVMTYTPTAGYSGSDSFTYTATNAGGTSAPATVSVTVDPDAPVANAVSVTVAYGSSANAVSLNVTGGAPASVAVAAQASNGTAVASGTTITYTPNATYFGPDSFTYTATNAGGTSAAATVSVTVHPQPPLANAVSSAVAFNSVNNPVTLDLSGGTATSVAIDGAASNGTATASGTTITYTPTTGYFGADSFTYTAGNAGGTSAPATVSVTVHPTAPIANAVSATVAYNSSNSAITLNITGGPATSVAVPGLPSSGTVSVSGTAITYTPTAGYFGADSFTYTATNGGGTSAPATVSIAVNPQPPITNAVSRTVAFDSSSNPITLNITGGVPVSVATPVLPVKGTVSISGLSIIYTPTTGYFGADSFTYTATNAGGTSAPATVSITVNPAPPVANPVSVTVAFQSSNNPVTLNITGGAAVSLATPTLPTHGTVTVSGLTITYTAASAYAGPDSFTYTATNAGGTSAPATVSVTIAPPPVPTTGSVSGTVAANAVNAPITLNLGGGAAISLAMPTPPSHGTATISGLTITYTPTAGYSGVDSFTYTATNLGGTSTPGTVSLTVSQPTLTLSALTTTGQVTAAYSSTITAALGSAPYSFAVTTGGLPAGLSLNGGGVLSGTATTAGAFNFTVTATDAYGATGDQAYAIVISAPAVAITSPAAGALPTVEAFGTYSQTFAASGGVGPWTFGLTAGVLPPGLALTSDGVMSGEPTTPGTYNFSLAPSDGSTTPGPYPGPPVAYSLTVTGPVVSLSPPAGALPTATTAQAYSQTFTAGGGVGPHVFTLVSGALPPGLSLSAPGVVSGAPTAAGSYGFTVSATDSHGFDGVAAYMLVVSDPVISVIAPAAGSLPTGVAYEPYSQTFTAAGGVGSHSFAVGVGSLPPGLTLTSGGVLSGAPTTSGTYVFDLVASDSSGTPGPFASAPVGFSVTVTAPAISLSPAAGPLPTATTASGYSVVFSASGGAGPHAYALTAGALPPGLSLSSGGLLTGAPTAAGSYTFTVAATDSHGFGIAQAYAIAVADPVVAITAPAAGVLPVGLAYTPYSQSFAATGGTGPLSFALAGGDLPPGISLDGAGLLSGVPTTPGAYNFSVAARDSSLAPGPFASAPVAYRLTVTAPKISLTPSTLPPGDTATPYSQAFAASGGTAPHGFALSAGSLPPGLSLTGPGVLSGQPSTAGAYGFSVTVTDTHGFSATNLLALVIADGAPVAAPDNAVTVFDQPVAIAVAVNDTGLISGLTVITAPTRGVVTISGLMATYAPNPGSFGVDSFTYAATGPGGTSAPTTVSVTVAAPPAPTVSPRNADVPYDSPGVAVPLAPSGVYASLAIVTPPAHGMATLSGTTASYVPAAGYYGPDAFTYSATGPGGTSAPATVSLTVETPPAPIVAPVSAVAPFDSPGVAVTLAPSGIYSTLVIVSPPAHGTVSLSGTVATYTPAPGYFGADSFSYAAIGPGGTSAPATVSLAVGAPPPPTVAPVSALAAFNSPGVAVSLAPFGVYATLAIVVPPAHGTVGLSGTTATYVPAPGYFGADSFAYTATGPGGTSAPATVSLTIGRPSAPTVAALSATVPFNSPGVSLPLAPAGVYAALAIANPPAHGTVSLSGTTAIYAPTADYFGPDSFAYTATGPGGTSAPATVSLVVAAPPEPVILPLPPGTPPPGPGGEIIIDLGEYSTGILTGFRINGAPRHGEARIQGGGGGALASPAPNGPMAAMVRYFLIYRPQANFLGVDAVTFLAQGPGGTSAPMTLALQVAGKAPNLSAQVASNASVTLNPTAGLVGGPFAGLRITRAPAYGVAVVQGLNIVFTPGITGGGATSLDYVIDLSFGPSAAGRIDLLSNLVPVAQALTATTLAGRPVTVRITDGVQGGPFTAAAVVSVAPVGAGTGVIAATGTGGFDLTFTPAGAFDGRAVVGYTLGNAFGTASSTLAVTVEARPDPGLDPDVRGLAGSQVRSARRAADAQISNFQRRLESLHDGDNSGSNGLRLNALSAQGDADQDPRTALARRLGRRSTNDPGEPGDDRSRDFLGLEVAPVVGTSSETARLGAAPRGGDGRGGLPVGVWASGAIDWGREDASGQGDARFTTQGVTAGADVRLSDTVIVGGGVGYGHDRSRVGDDGSRSRGRSVTAALYGSWHGAEAFYLDGVVGYVDLDFDLRRWARGLAGQPDAFATGERSGDVVFASAALGRRFDGDGERRSLYARVDARAITLNAFTEAGAGLAGLKWAAMDQDSLSATLGLAWRWRLDLRGRGEVLPSVRLEWSHEFEELGDQSLRYADWAASPTYRAQLDGWSRDALLVNLGGEWRLSDRLMLSFGYRGNLGTAGSSHGAEAAIRIGW